MGKVGKLKHENLVLFLGYCIFQDEKFLVYECMENGSLDVWLRNRTDAVEAMDWPTRFKICILWWLLATSKGDVCNFGVVILELVTGRTPTSQADVEGGNLVGWVGWMVANGREDDEQDPYFSTITIWKDEMLCVLSIA
ncbi:hypothetical protein VitviT2T_007364 [Vitis vinifera]|uniref:Serine-threonine/tyrosine-protein kinase catalytic domain-containing protein n=1 Tax=Vitis vinifera TaxID=29760 RepID=A0ABY9BZ02_VITVI|nr:hypothetical protein VitviT2T_007364 [Vitis vinifera]